LSIDDRCPVDGFEIVFALSGRRSLKRARVSSTDFPPLHHPVAVR
jgi:hypothetical protein